MTATGDAPELLLQHHLKKLRLPSVMREYEKQARLCAAENVDHIPYLARLIELELIDREARMVQRRIKAAKFPATKTLESFDFDAIPSLNKKLVLDLARAELIDRRENLIALGPSGVGKSHIAIAIGMAACQRGIKVRFITAAAMVHELIEARDEKRLLRLQKQLSSHELLIIHRPGVWCSGGIQTFIASALNGISTKYTSRFRPWYRCCVGYLLLTPLGSIPMKVMIGPFFGHRSKAFRPFQWFVDALKQPGQSAEDMSTASLQIIARRPSNPAGRSQI